MNRTFLAVALLGLGLAATGAYATMPWSGAMTDGNTYAQEDCAEGQVWNQETGKCEAKSE